MILRRGNHVEAEINNQEDNTVVDGYVSTEQLYKNMVEAGKINLRSMYPKNEEMEARELDIIENETNSQIKNAFKTLGKKREQLIDEIYETKTQNNKIESIKKRINQLNEDIIKAEKGNKETYIKELEKQIEELKMIKQTT